MTSLVRITVNLAAAVLLAGCVTAPSQVTAWQPTHAVIGVRDAQLDPSFWIQLAVQPDRIMLDPTAIAAQNARLQQLDRSVHDIESLPPTLAAEQVRQWIEALSSPPESVVFDQNGREVSTDVLNQLLQEVQLGAIRQNQPTRYGLIVQRADVRTFPTRLRVFRTQGDTHIDRFQESALFPGTPVVVAHESRDGEWWFIVSPLYAAWVEKRVVALGTAQEVFDYMRKTPYVIVTGATARTVFTPEQPAVSELQLDMGVRVPIMKAWPADKPVNGQHPYTTHVIELPMRTAEGTLSFVPALLPKSADVSAGYLPLTQANLLRQSFKFLGERYGWGHSYNARDCSGFVSEVYRSFGVQLPRNTRDQGVSPALNRLELTQSDDHQARLAMLNRLQIGDLIYIPGHVMMMIGYQHGMPYVIHDTTGISYRNGAGNISRVDLNSVSVTPLTPLLLGDGQPMIDRIYSIQRIRQREP
jgi:cell wall-associated NlpC family hydrolase